MDSDKLKSKEEIIAEFKEKYDEKDIVEVYGELQ
ncbi:hypothetical protein B0H35_002139 [Clostridium acetobutylicum]|nr:hypothetical protein [Clostridium acetobutylicum]